MLIKEHFKESIEIKQKSLETIVGIVEYTAKIIADVLASGGKLLVCGNGGSAADAQHFAAELINRFEIERKPLPALALTTDSSNLTSIANDYSFDEVFSKQVEALGSEKDVLVAISTSGNSNSIIQSVQTALRKGMKVIVLTGETGGKIAELSHLNLDLVHVPSMRTARIQEVHILIIHAWCAYIDHVFGSFD